MPKLRRVSDGQGDCGALSQAIKWNEDGTFKEVISNRPTIGCSMLVRGNINNEKFKIK